MSFPVDFPNIPIARTRLGLKFNQGVFPADFSRKVSIHYHAGGKTDRWQGIVSTPALGFSDALTLKAFISSLQGMFGTFRLIDPDHRQPSTYTIGGFLADSTQDTADTTGVTADAGVFPGQGFVKGSGQEGHSLLTGGWAENSMILKEGDRIQVANQYFVVIEDALSDGAGESTLTLEPAIRTAFADNEPVVLLNPKLTVRLQAPVFLFTSGPRNLQPTTLAFEEVL